MPYNSNMDNLDYIDAYFEGGFSPEEASQFDKRIQEEPAFAEEVAFYLGAFSALQQADIEERKARFLELYRHGTPQGKISRMNNRRWIPFTAAAAVLAIAALAWLLFLRPADPVRLADKYIRENLIVLPVKMGGADQVQAGINLYNKGEFAEALRQFEDLLRSDSLHPAALLYAGIVSLRTENCDKALDYFIKLQTHSDPHVNPALFYEALTLMRRNLAGDSDHGKQLLSRIVREDLEKKAAAQELLSKM
jgi:tetratricopeptide (TPR) repeat protein